MRIYIACLASYNAGTLYGAWIDIESLDVEEIQEAIDTVLLSSPEPDAEEWAIHDYDGIPSSFGENPDLAELVSYCEALREHGDAWIAYCELVGIDYATSSHFEESYQGCWCSEQDFAEELISDCFEIPKHLDTYIDYEKWTRDIFMSDYSSEEINGEVYVFLT